MKKHIQLSIPTPCHENWDKMNPVEKGRFCDSCQKKVIDFSNMSDREIAIFFKKPSTGSVCGRFMQDQLDRSLEIPKKRIPWVKYFFQITIPLFLANLKSTAQGNVSIKEIQAAVFNPSIRGRDNKLQSLFKNIFTDSIITSNPLESKNVVLRQGGVDVAFFIKSNQTTLKGKVIDENEAPISNVVVSIKGTNIATASDATGSFKLNIDKIQDQVTLVASYVGFSTVERSINLISDSTTNIIMQSTPAIGGEVVVVGYAIRKKRKSEIKNAPLLKQIKDTAIKLFKVFPNPVRMNSSLNMETGKLETGSYLLQLFNPSGQLMFTKEMYIDEEARVLNFQLPSVSAGTYFLRMTNKQSGKSSAEKIIIQ